MAQKPSVILIVLSVAVATVATAPTVASHSFSNTLTGFTGDSTQPGTQAAVAAAGFDFFSTDAGPAVQFDPDAGEQDGAHFGEATSGDDGRNYMRTIHADYANFSFVTEITLVVPNLDQFDEVNENGPPYQSGFLGLGAGDTALFGWPDWSTQFSSLMIVPEKFGSTRQVTTMYTANDSPIFANTELPALDNGTHRLRLSSFNQLAVFSMDLNYTGGAFVEDFRAPALNVSSLFGVDGWPTEESKIYFGGDDGTAFKDFEVDVDGAQGIYGDLNSDGNINSLDWVVLRTNLESDLTGLGLSLKDTYLRGDLTVDDYVGYEDFKAFQTVFEQFNGSGSFAAMLSGVPEPSTTLMFLSAALFMFPVMRRSANRE